MSRTYHIQYFAILREQRGRAEENLQSDSPDAATLYEELRRRHGFTLPLDRIRVAVNGEFAPWPAPLKGGENLVFVPPVAGG